MAKTNTGETVITMRLKPNRENVTIELILEGLLKLNKRDATHDLVPAAKRLLEMISKRGEDGIFSQDWKQTAKELELPEHQYFELLKKLKLAGLIYKSKGKYHLSPKLRDHLGKVHTTLKSYMDDLVFHR